MQLSGRLPYGLQLEIVSSWNDFPSHRDVTSFVVVGEGQLEDLVAELLREDIEARAQLQGAQR